MSSSSSDESNAPAGLEGDWEVLRVIDMKFVNGGRTKMYKVKWKDMEDAKWSEDQYDEWLEADLMDCPDLVEEFKQRRRLEKEGRSRSRSVSVARMADNKDDKKGRRSVAKEDEGADSDEDAPRKTERRKKKGPILDSDDDKASSSSSRSRSKTAERKDDQSSSPRKSGRGQSLSLTRDSRGPSTSRSSSSVRPSRDQPTSSAYLAPSTPTFKAPKEESLSSQKRTRSATREPQPKEAPRDEKRKEETRVAASMATVLRVVDVRVINGGRTKEYRVKWKDIGDVKWSEDAHDSWLEAKEMDCPELVAEFKERRKQEKQERRSRSVSIARKDEKKSDQRLRRSSAREAGEANSDEDVPRKTEKGKKKKVIDSDDEDSKSRSSSRSTSKTVESNDDESSSPRKSERCQSMTRYSPGPSTSRSSSAIRPLPGSPTSSGFRVPSFPVFKVPKVNSLSSSQKRTRSATREPQSKEGPLLEKRKKEASEVESTETEPDAGEATATMEAVETPAAASIEEQMEGLNFVQNPSETNGYEDGHKGLIIDHTCITFEDGEEMDFLEVYFEDLGCSQLIANGEVKKHDPEEYSRYMEELMEEEEREQTRQGAANYKAAVKEREEREAKELAEKGE